jgi:rhodanese-related sulfurtransferase
MVTAAKLVQKAATAVMEISPAQTDGFRRAGAGCILDVREPEEVAEHGAIPGAVRVPRGLLEFRADPASPSHLPELQPSVATIVYDTAGHRAVLAAATLRALGYEQVAFLAGGFEAWIQAGLPVAGSDRVGAHAVDADRPTKERETR